MHQSTSWKTVVEAFGHLHAVNSSEEIAVIQEITRETLDLKLLVHWCM